MPRIEEVATRFNHGLIVTGVAAVFMLHRQQVQVTLTRTVKTMACRADHAIIDRRQRFGANRAGEHQASNLIRVW